MPKSCLQWFWLFCLAMTFFWPTPIYAENWRTNIKDIFLPSHFVAVDKEKQKFFFYEKNSPLRLKYEFVCTTGQKPGDKQVLNDLKTPEGIYFVEYKIASGLDFREYGGVAYTLNYPNPVDKLRGKTGHGIWIHSKGFGLVPTKGCVAIGLKEIDTVGPKLTPGTAVILANGMVEPSLTKEEKLTAQILRNQMQAWTNAWSARSSKMFNFYDREAYSKATEDFAAFKANKERVFKMIQDIRLFNRDIHVLEGPGYWVTWAEQCYTASNHTSEGIRRLYWQKGDDNRFRIVGMEWLPRDVGMLAEYKKGKLIAQGPTAIVDDANDAPTKLDLSMPEDAPDEKPARRRQLLAVSDPLVPTMRPNNPFKEFNWNTDQSGTNANTQPADTSDAPLTQEQILAKVASLAERFVTLLGQKDPQIFDFFSQTKFNRLPGVFKQRSLRGTIRDLEQLQNSQALDITCGKAIAEENKNLIITKQEVLIHDRNNTQEGEYRLFWTRDDDDNFVIVGLNFFPKTTGLIAAWLEKITPSVNYDLETWRKAWEKGDVEAYVNCYANNALQQGRRGLNIIRRQKEELWSKVKPQEVTFSGLRMTPVSNGIKVDMAQTYIDSSGKKEHGLKTLILQYEEDQWKILQEDWQKLPQNNRN